jgi:O-antigen ligase
MKKNNQGPSRSNSFEALLSFFSIFSFVSFFCLFIIFNKQYSNGYMELYSSFIAGLALLTYLISIFNRKNFLKIEILILFFIIAILSGFLINYAIYGFNKGAVDTILEFLIRTIPAILMGIVAAKKDILKKMVEVTDIIIVFFTLTLFIIFLNGYINGISRPQLVFEFGLDYQGISYLGAYAFGMNLFMILYGKKELTSKFLKGTFFQAFRIMIIPIQVLVCLYSGGRGGFVLLIVYIFFVIGFDLFIRKDILRFSSKIIFVLFSTMVLIYIFYDNELIIAGFNRITEFINPSGSINWEGTSGRGIVYQQALELIGESPIFGYGIAGGAFNGLLSTHNLFFEILMDGGLIYLISWLCLLTFFIKKLYSKIKLDYKYNLIAIIFLADFVNLMFSSIYLRTSAMFFCLSFILIENAIKKN